MKLRTVLETLVQELDERGVHYALIGGLAVGLLGAPRSTVDLDLLVAREDLGAVDEVMEGMTYELRHRSENVSQYVSPLAAFGQIDLLHAFRPAARRMLGRARRIAAFDGQLELPVLRVEDLIGLKVQALVNDPGRREREILDMRALMRTHREDLEWPLVAEYFALFGEEELLARLRAETDVAR